MVSLDMDEAVALIDQIVEGTAYEKAKQRLHTTKAVR